MTDTSSLPQHVAIIMDGNGRWAKERNLPRVKGHQAGAESVRAMVKACIKIGIPTLSIYSFSTENWSRPEKEVSFLMDLFSKLLSKEGPELHKQGVRVCILGDRTQLKSSLVSKINAIEDKTKANTCLTLNILLNYGARQEILAAVHAYIQDGAKDLLTEDLFSSYLYSKNSPDPDLIIRTSGEHRISNFLLWQAAYAEFYFTDTLWPDFNEAAFNLALENYQQRQRRFGGT